MSFGNSTLANKLPVKELADKNDLVVGELLMKKLHYLHKRFQSLEWSGVLFYTIENIEGKIKCKAIDFKLMDIGSAAYTEYEYTDEIMEEYMDLKLEHENVKMGHLHTHHTMKAFFSGTDMDELHQNTPNHEYYLSLIVNTAGEYVAKIAFIGKEEYSTNFVSKVFNLDGEKKTREILYTIDSEISKEPVMVSVDANKPVINWDEVVGEEYVTYVNKINTSKRAPNHTIHYPNGNGWKQGQNNRNGIGYNRHQRFNDNTSNKLTHRMDLSKREINKLNKNEKKMYNDGLRYNKKSKQWERPELDDLKSSGLDSAVFAPKKTLTFNELIWDNIARGWLDQETEMFEYKYVNGQYNLVENNNTQNVSTYNNTLDEDENVDFSTTSDLSMDVLSGIYGSMAQDPLIQTKINQAANRKKNPLDKESLDFSSYEPAIESMLLLIEHKVFTKASFKVELVKTLNTDYDVITDMAYGLELDSFDLSMSSLRLLNLVKDEIKKSAILSEKELMVETHGTLIDYVTVKK